MKMKKNIIITCVLATLICSIFVIKDRADAANEAADSKRSNVNTLATGYSKADYQLVSSLKTANYNKLSVYEFNNNVWKVLDNNSNFYNAFERVFVNIKKSDPLYNFIRMDLRLSCFEWVSKQIGDTPNISNGVLITKTLNNKTFYYEVNYTLLYKIINAKKISVAERTNLLDKISKEFQNYVNTLTKAQLDNVNIEKNVLSKLKTIIDSNSNTSVSITGEVHVFVL